MRRVLVVLVGLVASIPFALASPAPAELDCELVQLRVDAPADLFLGETVAALAGRPVIGEPLWELARGEIRLTQYWQNSTVVHEPGSGGTLHRTQLLKESETIAFRATRLTLVEANTDPEVRFFTPNANMEAGTGTTLSTLPLAEWDDRVVATFTQSSVRRFYEAPTDSGWIRFHPQAANSVESAAFLVDGWTLRLFDGARELEVKTGVSAQRIASVYNGGLEQETYSFLVLELADASLRFHPDLPAFEGWTQAPSLAWEGPATVTAQHGRGQAGDQTFAFQDEPVGVDGRFFAAATFDDVGSARLSVEGEGDIARAHPLSLPSNGSPDFAPMMAATALGAAILTVVYLTRRRARHLATVEAAAQAATAAARPPAPEGRLPDDAAGLLAHVQKQPLDSEAHFRLGVALVREQGTTGLRHLDRAFRLQPEGILRFLEDPEYAPIRDRDDVRHMLRRIHRDNQWKIWGGYA